MSVLFIPILKLITFGLSVYCIIKGWTLLIKEIKGENK